MNINDIIDIVTGLDEPTKQLVVRDLRPELSSALSAVSSHPLDTLQPAPRDIMNAFKLCPVGNIKVVLIGQDPYRKHAQGLSFSVPRTEKVPPSLQNIYKCLKHNGLIDEIPTHGDLTNWAVQGVLLLNTMLTVGETSHREWIPYTNKLIEKLSKQSTHIVFILLGKHAAKLKDLIGPNHEVLEWGHPSPLNAANRTLNPTNFIHCDVFTRANDALIWNNKTPINWNPDECVYSASAIQDLKSDTLTDNLPFSPNNTLYIFTDGGSIDLSLIHI